MCSESRPRKILVLNGSPHRADSTTMTVVNAFVEGLLASGRFTAETAASPACSKAPFADGRLSAGGCFRALRRRYIAVDSGPGGMVD